MELTQSNQFPLIAPYYRGKSVFVTGGAGLIGSFLVDHLVECGANVTVVDNLYRGKLAYIAQREHVKFIRQDLAELRSGSRVFEDAEIVFHLASKVLGIGYSLKNHTDMLFANDAMTNGLVQALENATNLKDFFVCSSSCVYDDDGPDTTPENYCGVGTPEKANLGYGIAKRILEEKTLFYAKQRGLKLTIARPFNVYGERYTWAGEFSQGLPSLVKRILDNRGASTEIWGTGNQRRTYMHAQDCSHIMLGLAAHNHETGIFNIGTRETISLLELAKLISRLAGVEPLFTFRLDMPEGRFIKSADETLLSEVLPGFKPRLMSIEQGLSRMLAWYKNTFN